MRGITPPGRTRSSRIAFRARLRPSLRPISCPRTSSRASMRCPCVFAGSRDERDLIESSTDTRSSTFRACIRSTENDSRSRERPSSETCTCPSDHRSTARVSTFRGHRLELFADTRARPRGEGEGELTSLLVGALRAGASGLRGASGGWRVAMRCLVLVLVALLVVARVAPRHELTLRLGVLRATSGLLASA